MDGREQERERGGGGGQGGRQAVFGHGGRNFRKKRCATTID